MVTRISKSAWTALVAGLFLMSGFSHTVHAQESIVQQECRVGDQQGTAPGTLGSNFYEHDPANCPECQKKNRFSNIFSRGRTNGSNGNDSCDDGAGGRCKLKGGCKLFGGGKSDCEEPCLDANGKKCNKKGLFGSFSGKCNKKDNDCDDFCQAGNGCKMCNGNGCKNCCHGNCYKGVDPGYCDPRDLEMYAAQGYGVPMAVPLAPIVKHTYHYGWGVPSSRVVRVGANYNRWYPAEPFTQSGGSLSGGQFPVVYQPTDTTQLGFYYVHTPRWMPVSRKCYH